VGNKKETADSVYRLIPQPDEINFVHETSRLDLTIDAYTGLDFHEHDYQDFKFDKFIPLEDLIRKLGQLGNPKSVGYLCKLLNAEWQWESNVYVYAKIAGGYHRESGEGVGYVMAHVYRWILEALGEFHNESVVEPLGELLLTIIRKNHSSPSSVVYVIHSKIPRKEFEALVRTIIGILSYYDSPHLVQAVQHLNEDGRMDAKYRISLIESICEVSCKKIDSKLVMFSRSCVENLLGKTKKKEPLKEGTIVLTCTVGPTFYQEQFEFSDDVVHLKLRGKRITSIDFAPLTACSRLQSLYLFDNQLQSIDLAACSNLQSLYLYENQLQSIDLSPLSVCTNLQKLSLDSNQLQTINLTPLSSCSSFQELWLSRNQLLTIDLSPLSSLTSLQTLDLSSNKIQQLDLAPLASCSSLQLLDLGFSQLQSIDLSPLSVCANLQKLSLGSNQLQTIDLAPLSSCTSLQSLSLGGNIFQTINLAPLASCSSLQSLSLGFNQLQSIDLSPLATCSSLQELWLIKNQLESIDATSLFSDPSIKHDSQCTVHSWLKRKDASYTRPSSTYPWPFLSQVVKQYKKDRRVQQDVLSALGLENYGFIDHDLRKLLRSLRPDTPIAEACELVKQGLVKKIVAAADKGGITTGLKLEELLTQQSEIAKRAQSIIELRDAEIQQIRVGVRNDEVDLQELWLTAYGYEILSALDMRLTTDLEGLEQIKSAYAKLGFELKTGETSIPGVKMSKPLKRAIWWIVENRGKPWSEIADKKL